MRGRGSGRACRRPSITSAVRFGSFLCSLCEYCLVYLPAQMLAYVFWWEAPLGSGSVKGVAPVSISHIMTPRDHKSALPSWPEPSTTSGAMNSGVPTIDVAGPSARERETRPKS